MFYLDESDDPELVGSSYIILLFVQPLRPDAKKYIQCPGLKS